MLTRLLVPLAVLPLLVGADWSQFRGAGGRGVAIDQQIPIKFGPEENVAWKVSLPGKGVCGPIVVGDRVVVTAASGPVLQDKLHVLCFDATTGRQLWQRQFWATGRPHHHPTSSNAAPTPASDGERIFAFFSSNDLVCLDLQGNLLWYRGLGLDYPKAGNDVGMSSSPVVIGETVVVQVECQGDSFAAGLDTATGENRWRIDRPQRANWVTPAALHSALGKDLVLLQSSTGLSAHEALTGKQVWSFNASCSGIPSLAVADNRIFLPAGGMTVLEVPATESAPSLLWTSNKVAPGNSSPVIDGDRLYVLTKAGILTAADAQTGQLVWQTRLKGTFWATPVVADGYAYCVNQDGDCLVVKLGEKGEIVHSVAFGEPCYGTPAVAGNALFLRGNQHLWKIAN
jgi:outer membrane protein assembly factor BamB